MSSLISSSTNVPTLMIAGKANDLVCDVGHMRMHAA